jgi:hypothetical protein
MDLDYAECKATLKRRLGRPTADEAFTVTTTDDVYDQLLTEAQRRINALLATFIPDAVWPAPVALTSSDGGYTYGFGMDTDGAAIFAFGHFEVFEARKDIPNFPLTEGIDFVVRGSVLVMPDNQPRTFADSGPWALFASPSTAIDSSHEPTIPKVARPAMITDAEIRGWKHLGLDASHAEYDFENKDWPELLALVRTQSMKKGSQPLQRRPRSYLLGRRPY